MAKVIYSIEPVFCITVLGEKNKSNNDFRKDDGLIGRLLRFMLDNEIFAAKRNGYCGRGTYIGFYTTEDAVKVEAWLLEQGAKEKKR